MKNKRGQFYLVAALVIIGIIAGLATVYNTAKVSREDTTVYDLSSEINYESNQIIDSGVFNSLTNTEITDNIKNLTEFYAESNPGDDLVIVYGDRQEVKVVSYINTESGDVCLSFGGAQTCLKQQSEKRFESQFSNPGNEVMVELGSNITYRFDLRPGKNFFIVLKKERGGERFVSLPRGETGVSGGGNPPPASETNCLDGIDNDGDGDTDVFDSDCPTCVDSDSGDDPLVAGFVLDQTTPLQIEDTCAGADLIERVCTNGVKDFRIHTCANSCNPVQMQTPAGTRQSGECV